MKLSKFRRRFSSIWLGTIAAAALLDVYSAPAESMGALTPVPIQNVTIDDGFWTPKLKVWRGTTIQDVWNKFDGYGAFANFDRVAAKQTGGHKGEPWWDGLVYETITASADALAAHPDAALQSRLDGYVARIAAAANADPDGYVNTACTLDGIGVRWSNPPAPGDKHDDVFPHTVYNASCLVEAGVHLYRATGKTQLLQIATRMANYMCGIMGSAPKQNIIPGHAVGEWAFTKLYLLYHEQPNLKVKIGVPVSEADYLKLAEFWIEARGHTEGRATNGAYNQDDISVFKQPTLEGHAVRSALLAAGVAAAAAANHRADYREVGVRWWQNMQQAKMYVTGGLGAVPNDESFGPDYYLPNKGYAETCAAAVGGFFSSNMNLLTGDAKYVDVLERELYNGALSGVSLAGSNYFYTNLLSAGPEHRRWDWQGGSVTGTPCCPPMFLKLQGALPGYIYATDATGAFVNLYIGSSAEFTLKGSTIKLQQKTNYPWDGEVTIVVTPPGTSSATFPLNLRIPGWAHGVTAEVNGTSAPLNIVNNYLCLERVWNPGDTVTLHLPMRVERVKADPQVAANVGRVALMRGPIVYCLEGVDNGGRVTGLQIPSTASVVAEKHDDLLGGVMTLRGTAVRLRKENGVTRNIPAPFVAIPFYANANRAPSDVAVWIADDPAVVQPIGLAGEAVPSSSYCNGSDTIYALNDGLEAKASDDDSIPRLTWWSHRGTQEWVQLTFPTPQRLTGTDVYWWDESRVRRDCRVPQSWTVQYLENGQWKNVAGASGYGTRTDVCNHVGFQSITTTALRIVAQLQSGWSGGILEWGVTGDSALASAGSGQP